MCHPVKYAAPCHCVLQTLLHTSQDDTQYHTKGRTAQNGAVDEIFHVTNNYVESKAVITVFCLLLKNTFFNCFEPIALDIHNILLREVKS
jgi:hypothetical protein